MIIGVSFIGISFESADALPKNYATVFDDVRNDHVFGSKVQITVPDMFIRDRECNLNQVSVATQWLKITSINWIETGVTAGKVTSSISCYNDPIIYYGQSFPLAGASTGRVYEDYKVRDAVIGDLVNFKILNADRNHTWSISVDETFSKTLLVPNSVKAQSVDYGIESEIVPSEKYSSIPNTHFNNFQKYDNNVWVNSDVLYNVYPSSEYLKQKCPDSQHFVVGNVLSIDCNRSTVVNTAPSLATPVVRDSGTFKKTVTLVATDPDKDYVQFYLDRIPDTAQIYVNGIQITNISDPIPSNGKSTTFVYDSFSGAADTLIVTATDERVGHSVRKIINFFQGQVNQPPTLANIPNYRGNTGDAISFTVSATDDAPSNTLRYSMSNFPPGASINSNTGLFTWTPSNTQTGNFYITFKVTDNGSPVKYDYKRVILSIANAPVIIPPTTGSTIFSDDFEGNLSQWTLTGDDEDWELRSGSSTRTTGNVASSDDCDKNCYMVSDTINASKATTLTFDRYVSTSIDSNEGLRVEVSTNNGRTWSELVFYTTVPRNDDSTWHTETFDISSYQSSNFKIKFTGVSSSSSEKVQIDDVTVTGSSGGTVPPPTTISSSFEDNFDDLSNWTKSGDDRWNIVSTWREGMPSDGDSNNKIVAANNCDNSCMLTSNTIDLSSYSSATLELSRFVDRSLDGGEYLSIEVFNGRVWTEIAKWGQDNSQDTDDWEFESIDISRYLDDNSKIKITSLQSSSSEDTGLDYIRIIT